MNYIVELVFKREKERCMNMYEYIMSTSLYKRDPGKALSRYNMHAKQVYFKRVKYHELKQFTERRIVS